MGDAADFVEAVGFFVGEEVGVFEDLFYPVGVTEFEVLGEVGDTRMAGQEFFVGASELFLFKDDAAGFCLDVGANNFEQGAFAGTGFSCDGYFLTNPKGKADVVYDEVIAFMSADAGYS